MTSKVLIIAFGSPGAGKSTALSLVSQKVSHFQYISTGELARRQVEENTPTGQSIKYYEKTRQNFPPELLGNLVLEAVNQSDKKFIAIDSYPKNDEEVAFLINTLPKNFKIKIMNFENSNMEELKKRLINRGRQNESMPVIEGRLNHYNEKITNLLNHSLLANYEKYIINADKGIKETYMQVAQMVEQLSPN